VVTYVSETPLSLAAACTVQRRGERHQEHCGDADDVELATARAYDRASDDVDVDAHDI
jgi:hypothetical protein